MEDQMEIEECNCEHKPLLSYCIKCKSIVVEPEEDPDHLGKELLVTYDELMEFIAKKEKQNE